MSFKTIFKTFKRALPAIIAGAPAIIAAVRDVREAAKPPRATRPD